MFSCPRWRFGLRFVTGAEPAPGLGDLSGTLNSGSSASPVSKNPFDPGPLKKVVGYLPDDVVG